MQSLPSTIYNHILQSEHTDSWMVALQEYDTLQLIYESSKQNRNSFNPTQQSQSQLQLQQSKSDCLVVDDEIATLAFIERGRFRCLYELGQMEAIIEQVI